MKKILVLYAHPAQRHSRVNSAMAARAQTLDDITFVDLYAEYPRFKIDVEREQQRLLQHDVIVLQFPMMWYSTPSLLKEWQDLVLEYGFAYGEGGDKLAGKTLALAISTGGSKDAFSTTGYQQHQLPDFLTPLRQTAHLCQLHCLPPYVLFGALSETNDADLNRHVDCYCQYLGGLRDQRLPADSIGTLPYFEAHQLTTLLETGA